MATPAAGDPKTKVVASIWAAEWERRPGPDWSDTKA